MCATFSLMEAGSSAECAQTQPIRCLLINAQALLRGGLRAVLEASPDIRVLADASSMREGVALVRSLPIQVVVVALAEVGSSSPGQIADHLTEFPQGLPVVLVSRSAGTADLRRLVAAGTLGFVSVESDPHELWRVVRGAARGNLSFCASYSSVVGRLLNPALGGSRELTPRQLEVLHLIDQASRHARSRRRWSSAPAPSRSTGARSSASWRPATRRTRSASRGTAD